MGAKITQKEIEMSIGCLDGQIKNIENLMNDIIEEKEEKNKCLFCEEIFERGPKDNNKKFCSRACGDKYRYEHRKEYMRKYQRDALNKRIVTKYGKENLVQCLICGKYYRQLGTHIVQRHGMTALEYREYFGFDLYETRHTLAPDLRELYGEQALENGTYKNLEKGEKTRYKKGDKGLGKYHRSKETMARLKTKDKSNV